MSELDDIAATFGVSEPVFTVEIRNRDLHFNCKKQYTPYINSNDPINVLVANYYYEHLNAHKGCYEATVSIERVYIDIVTMVRRVAINTSHLKNPKQSKLHKWLCTQYTGYHNEQSAGFIALYRYLMNNNLADCRDKNNPHAKNVIGILEMMREKYEK
jgi:hypothetical protein